MSIKQSKRTKKTPNNLDIDINDNINIILLILFYGARWSSSSTFAFRSRGPWFESYTGLT